ncbi:hypothetical protein [Bacillus sp. MUM 13]|uniref:hypothetical protein n=1 Tax=Bacillus sp. MUM 13 TaxID=1678001 RepID=UPI0008F594BE|nr:hypothetical protein [Bacillus sp. MUM 13]OIK08820.1 hypothetical protein BIV59_18730 [Bacillus sp. MUM 13]
MFKPKKLLLFFLVSGLLLGGCQMNNGANEPVQKKPIEKKDEELPKARAFQDDFTKGFIDSSKSKEDGYFIFKSKTGNYKMLIPNEGIVNDFSYSNKGNKSEFYTVSIKYKDGSEAAMQISYNGELSNSRDIVKYSLESLKNELDIVTKFKKITTDKNQIYAAPFELKYKGSRNYGYGGYIYPLEGYGGITLHYFKQCLNNEQDCKKETSEQTKSTAVKIMSSITFIKEKESD